MPSLAPGDIREYATKLFENRGAGRRQGRDNGLVPLVALDGACGSRPATGSSSGSRTGLPAKPVANLAPEFRYWPSTRRATRIIGRIAQGRNVQLTGVEPPRAVSHPRTAGISIGWIILFVIVVIVISRMGGGPGRPVQRWGRRGWSGWSSGVGPFGGGFGGFGGGGFGGGGGGGFGGGFGGFGGGGSGGGGGGSSW